jgi:hypothetical protein
MAKWGYEVKWRVGLVVGVAVIWVACWVGEVVRKFRKGKEK